MLVERCRLVTLGTPMVLTNLLSTPTGASGAGTGTESDPYKIDRWDRISIGVTESVYANSPDYHDPNSY